MRYDFRTATRLHDLAAPVRDRWGDSAAEIGRRLTDPDALAAALDDLPGWGPVTVGPFLRELRGVWPGARLPLDRRAAEAAEAAEAATHLGWLTATDGALEQVGAIAVRAGFDARDLEAGPGSAGPAASPPGRVPGWARLCRPGWDGPRRRGRDQRPYRPAAVQTKVGGADTEVTR